MRNVVAIKRRGEVETFPCLRGKNAGRKEDEDEKPKHEDDENDELLPTVAGNRELTRIFHTWGRLSG
jgi:hypothetical protein